MAGKLTNKQQAFVENYLANGFNATRAAISAGYSERSARQEGSRLLTNDDIASYVRERITEIAMSADEVLLRLADHARSSMGDFIHPDSLSVDLRQARDNNKLHLIKKVKYVTRTDEESQTETVEFELYDAQAALVHLGRHHGLFTDKTDITSGGQPLKAYIGISPDDWDE